MTQRERQVLQLIEKDPLISQQQIADKLGIGGRGVEFTCRERRHRGFRICGDHIAALDGEGYLPEHGDCTSALSRRSTARNCAFVMVPPGMYSSTASSSLQPRRMDMPYLPQENQSSHAPSVKARASISTLVPS